jgi:predicted CopG family antitoxin
MSIRVRLSEEAYERLAARKRADETFSDVVLRLTEDRSLFELAGILSDEEAGELRETVAERRDHRSVELADVPEEMDGT